MIKPERTKEERVYILILSGIFSIIRIGMLVGFTTALLGAMFFMMHCAYDGTNFVAEPPGFVHAVGMAIIMGSVALHEVYDRMKEEYDDIFRDDE